MKKADFTHLHVHSAYSLGESVLKIPDVLATCKKNGFYYAALTDLNNLYGAVDFYFQALNHGIKPVIGAEISFKEGNLVLLCKNYTGFSNLVYIVNQKNIKEEININILKENSQGLIVLSGYENSRVVKYLKYDKLEELESWLLSMKEWFGADFFVEINTCTYEQNHSYMHLLEGIAENFGIKTVLTNTVNYLIAPHYKLLDAYKCILNGEKYYSVDREKVNSNQAYYKLPTEMKSYGFKKAYENANEIARKCNLILDENQKLPNYDFPQEFGSSAEYLLYLTSRELSKKYSEDNNQARKRLDKELKIISRLNFSDYFLIVWDIVKYARKKGITVGPGRGSAVGSIVAYLLDITEVDPLKHNLIFERFLTMKRAELPDIDIDVCSQKRDILNNYIRKRFKKEKVASIISFGTFKSAMAVRETGKSLEVSDGIIESIMMYIDKRLSLERNIKQKVELRNMMKNNKDVKKVLIGAQKLEGIIKHISQHAAGIVIYPDNMERAVPCIKEEHKLITQWDKYSLEKLGILKIDLLSLKTLTTIDNIILKIKKTKNAKKDFNINYEDAEVYKMISRGLTSGLFQLDTPHMTRSAMLIKPDCFEKLCILTALTRPGARENMNIYLNHNENEQINKLKNDKRVWKILKSTNGVIIYQEQIMELAKEIAGFSLEEADKFRKAISLKNSFIMDKLMEDFVERAVAKKTDKELAKTIYNHILRFAGYGFNKAHAVAYSALTYKCAWFKKKYPIAFYSQLLNSEIDNIDKINHTIREMREENIKVLPPHLLKSKTKFSASTKGIRFSFSGIKGIGVTNAKSVEKFVKFSKNKLRDFDEFILKAKSYKISEHVLKALIFSGACDFLKVSRKYMIENIHQNINYESLFGENTSSKSSTSLEYDENYLREKEKEYMGLSFTRTVLDDYMITIKLLSEEPLMEAKRIKYKKIKVAGIIQKIDREYIDDKSFKSYFILEDHRDSMKVYYNNHKNFDLNIDDVVLALIDNEAQVPELVHINKVQEVFDNPDLKIILKINDLDIIEELRNIFDLYQGKNEVLMLADTPEGKVMLQTEHMIEINEILLEELEELIGIDNIQLRFEKEEE
ncbi:MAG: DNA polymerase III subunit alpha [Candidatus Muiribacteriota bacterium]